MILENNDAFSFYIRYKKINKSFGIILINSFFVEYLFRFGKKKIF
jgi:hypothetical protein